jgi:hypothetical protein
MAPRIFEKKKNLRATETIIRMSAPVPKKDHNILVNNFLRDMIYLLTAIGLTPGGSSTVHIYTQTVHRTTHAN